MHAQSLQVLDYTSNLQEAMGCGLLAVHLVSAVFTKQCSCVLLAVLQYLKAVPEQMQETDNHS